MAFRLKLKLITALNIRIKNHHHFGCLNLMQGLHFQQKFIKRKGKRSIRHMIGKIMSKHNSMYQIKTTKKMVNILKNIESRD